MGSQQTIEGYGCIMSDAPRCSQDLPDSAPQPQVPLHPGEMQRSRGEVIRISLSYHTSPYISLNKNTKPTNSTKQHTKTNSSKIMGANSSAQFLLDLSPEISRSLF